MTDYKIYKVKDEVFEEVEYKRWRMIVCSNPEYPPQIIEERIFSVPSDITDIKQIEEFIEDITGVWVFKILGELLE